LRRPVGTGELAERLGLHPNGVRAHLERLREAGLVARERPARARGRPRDMWAVAPGARPADEPPSAYQDLGRWLVRVIASRPEAAADAEEHGRRIGREIAPHGDPEPESALRATLASLGFQPERERHGGGLTYRLCNCPYREVVRQDQEVVCGFHRGLTRGLLDELAPDTELAGFLPRDPDDAGCVVELRGGLAE
jgi:predicted ArsR family transcriptional regulator